MNTRVSHLQNAGLMNTSEWTRPHLLNKIYRDIVLKDMKSLFSEPMSINFEVPSRFTNTELNIKAFTQSLIQENSVSLIEDSKRESGDISVSYQGNFDVNRNKKKKHQRSKSGEIGDTLWDRAEFHKLPKMWEIEDRLQNKPFHRAILKLREIDQREGPMKKLRLLEQVNLIIQEEITQFWKGIPINNNHLIITSDTKIPLYIYVVIKAKIVNLAAQIRFIQEFTTNFVHEGFLFNNLAVYESAMTIVADKERNTLENVLSQQEVFEQCQNAYKESFATSVLLNDIDPFVDFTMKSESVFEN